MHVLIAVASVCTIGYALILMYYHKHWRPAHLTEKTPGGELPFCSVVIAARNEEHAIGHCLQSIMHQDYPHDRYEIIVVDDGSEDRTGEVVKEHPGVQLLYTSPDQQGKKHALAKGIAATRGEIIVTTDADCTVLPGWLHALIASFDEHTQCVTGPVLIREADDAFTRFQALDLAGLAGITASGIQSGLHHLANGANMAFLKSAFDRAGGFTKHMAYASGDDLFLVQTLATAGPGSVRYAFHPQAEVFTQTCDTWKALFRQRIRWATKVKGLPEHAVFTIWVFVWLTVVVQLIALAVAVFYSFSAVAVVTIYIIATALIEYDFLKRIARHYGMESHLKGYLWSVILQRWYVICIGVLAAFRRRYVWKGRTLR